MDKGFAKEQTDKKDQALLKIQEEWRIIAKFVYTPKQSLIEEKQSKKYFMEDKFGRKVEILLIASRVYNKQHFCVMEVQFEIKNDERQVIEQSSYYLKSPMNSSAQYLLEQGIFDWLKYQFQ